MTEDELLARVERALDRNSVALERHEQITDEHRLFIREMTLRSEKLGRQLVREIRESRESWSEELRIEMQLQRDVMLRILDRLPEPGGTD
jgi:hypothetical protein